ncbi:hypothetical protein [Embleya sp. MST-111070]|uniref:hypothetical protein n=1 Tax=Embleya sp. MST-111070 TaxID=3398231 RepID=UPI003F737865
MDRVGVHGYLEVRDGREAEVVVDLFDWPDGPDAVSHAWTAVVDDGPVMAKGTRGRLHLDEESPVSGHAFVVSASWGHASQLSGTTP